MSSFNEKVTVLAKKIDDAIDAEIAAATTVELVEALEAYRGQLHATLAERAMAEALKGCR